MDAPLDLITLPPTIIGKYGLAWTVDLDAAYRARAMDRAKGAEIAYWLVEAPLAHPVFHSYWISVIHLREIPDQGPPIIYLDGATHEIMVGALDPLSPRQTMIETGVMRALLPFNFIAQFSEPSDAAADERVRRAVEMVCDGKLSPDSDFRTVWAALFGNNMLCD